jgi:hypothetical protein
LRSTVQNRQQSVSSLAIVNEPAGKNVAIAGSMLERDSPNPSRGMSGGTCTGGWRTDSFARDGQRPIAGEPVGPILPRNAHNASQQKGSEAGTVDEKVAGNTLA